MPTIEYCDNTNCALNNKFHCTADSVSFDGNGICMKAVYQSEDTDVTLRDEKEPDRPDEKHDTPFKESGDDWIKYI